MKTLVLLSALALLAFQAQADPLPEANEETSIEEQTGEEDQDVSISFGDPEGFALQDAASRRKRTCYCKKACESFEHVTGVCRFFPRRYICCHGSQNTETS
ncbi:alpha-defensin 9-like [Acomys russatus]|uniref:alpha-defensin 9-like n=1 Tax=Acomys russatus TaxID=60746 RepID=UPI0021E34435|nr:alpha-defensin 9-like [Acomys russatus]